MCSQFFACAAIERGKPDFEDWFENHFFGRCFFSGGYLGIIENEDVRRCGFNDCYRMGNIRVKRAEGTQKLSNLEKFTKLDGA